MCVLIDYRLAFAVQKSTNASFDADVKRKRGRPRKAPVRFEDYEVADLEMLRNSKSATAVVKNEHYEATGWNDD